MKIANLLSLLLGVVLALLAIQWIFSPSVAAESLNMNYLDGLGRNTQIRDFTALFLGTSIMSFISAYTKQYQWITSVGVVYFITALFNILGPVFYNAPLTYASLIAEVIFTLIALTAGFIYKSNRL